MSYTRDQWGNAVDERGYLRTSVEEWRALGIYPPPLVGSARDPEVVITILAAREAAMDPPPLSIPDERAVEDQIAAYRAQTGIGPQSPPQTASRAS